MLIFRKEYFSLFLIAFGSIFAIWQGLVKSSFLYGLIAFLLFFCSALFVFLRPITKGKYIFIVLGGVITALSVVYSFSSSNLINPALQGARFSMGDRLPIVYQFCKEKMTPEINRLAEVGIKVCLSKHINEQTQLLTDLSKAQYFGVGASTVDVLIQSVTDEEVDACALIYQEIERACPNAFLGMPQEEKDAMRFSLKKK